MKKRTQHLFVYLILGQLLFSGTCFAVPPIEWAPQKLTSHQKQGSLASYDVELTSKLNIENVFITATPNFEPYITISPSFLNKLEKNQPVHISVSLNLPIDMKIGTLGGVIQTRLSSGDINHSKTIAKPLPIEVHIKKAKHTNSPPDPGDDEDTTLLGIDRDQDGVRDDIQRYIASNYPDDKNVQYALLEMAKQYQIILLTADDPEASYNNANKMSRHGECLDFLVGEIAYDYINELHAEVMNTKARSLAYIKYNNNLAGEIFYGKPISEWANSCSFKIKATGGFQ